MTQFILHSLEQFVEERYPYSLTSYVSHDALYKENANDLVLYPSVASNSHYCNFAIHPNIVDQYLTFKKVIRFEVVEVNSDLSLVLKTGRVGEVINNSIVWRKGDEAEVDFNNLP